MSTSSTIGPSTVIARSDEPVAVEVDGTVVMMSIDQGMYFGLEGTGPRIWALLEQPRSVEQLCVALMTEFDIDADACRQEVMGFLEELRASKLVHVHDHGDAPAAPDRS